MRSHLLWEYREVEKTAPPPQGMASSGSWDGGGTTSVVLPLLFPREPGLPPPPIPVLADPTFSRRSRLRSPPPPPPPPAPIHSPRRPRPQPPGGSTDIRQAQSPPPLSSHGTNPHRMEEGLLQCHLGSSRGPKIPFVWGEPNWA